ncbi:transposase [Pseudomonas sp. IT-P2]
MGFILESCGAAERNAERPRMHSDADGSTPRRGDEQSGVVGVIALEAKSVAAVGKVICSF